MQKVIVLGNDHTNSLGIIQCLGICNHYMIAFLWGTNTGIVRNSIYTKEVYTASNVQKCIDLMLLKFSNANEKIPVIACCDIAAITLEKNRSRLENHFLFEYTNGNLSIENLCLKENQVRLAKMVGFHVPQSWIIERFDMLPDEIVYPCIVKPLISCEGAKVDIRICYSQNELVRALQSLKCTKRVIIQQYIDRDYEISILGCAKKNSSCLIPAIENKLTLYPKYVGLECLAKIEKLEDDEIIDCISSLIKKIGYVGLFSVEMMHCKHDGLFYFTEINLRNDGANSFIFKYGINLPLHFINDMLNLPTPADSETKPGYYIWDMHHFLSLMHAEISLLTWLKELRKSKGFMTYFQGDYKPFLRQYSNWILSKLCLRKEKLYE